MYKRTDPITTPVGSRNHVSRAGASHLAQNQGPPNASAFEEDTSTLEDDDGEDYGHYFGNSMSLGSLSSVAHNTRRQDRNDAILYQPFNYSRVSQEDEIEQHYPEYTQTQQDSEPTRYSQTPYQSTDISTIPFQESQQHYSPQQQQQQHYYPQPQRQNDYHQRSPEPAYPRATDHHESYPQMAPSQNALGFAGTDYNQPQQLRSRDIWEPTYPSATGTGQYSTMEGPFADTARAPFFSGHLSTANHFSNSYDQGTQYHDRDHQENVETSSDMVYPTFSSGLSNTFEHRSGPFAQANEELPQSHTYPSSYDSNAWSYPGEYLSIPQSTDTNGAFSHPAHTLDYTFEQAVQNGMDPSASYRESVPHSGGFGSREDENEYVPDQGSRAVNSNSRKRAAPSSPRSPQPARKRGRGRPVKALRKTMASSGAAAMTPALPLKFSCPFSQCRNENEFVVEAELQEHMLWHNPPFACPLHFANCKKKGMCSSESAKDGYVVHKNEWKRHWESVHGKLEWVCTQDGCQRKPRQFSRLDYFVEHCFRIHSTPDLRKQRKDEKNRKTKSPELQAFLDEVKTWTKDAETTRSRSPLTKLSCPWVNCDAVFEGENCMNKRMDHFATHVKGEVEVWWNAFMLLIEQESSPGELIRHIQSLNIPVRAVDDPYLVDWAVREGVIRESDGTYNFVPSTSTK